MLCYRLGGNLENVGLYACASRTRLINRTAEETFLFLPERAAVDEGRREFPVQTPDWWCLHAEAPEDRRHRFRFDDAIASTDGFFGADIFVSQTAVEKLEPHLRHECEFHPIPIQGAPEPHYVMWVMDCLDVVDFSKAQVREVDYIIKNRRPALRLLTYEFLEDKIRDRFLFRLTGGQLDETSLHDYATERFMLLVKKLKITGFHFYKARFDFKAIVPVRPRKSPQ